MRVFFPEASAQKTKQKTKQKKKKKPRPTKKKSPPQKQHFSFLYTVYTSTFIYIDFLIDFFPVSVPRVDWIRKTTEKTNKIIIKQINKNEAKKTQKLEEPLWRLKTAEHGFSFCLSFFFFPDRETRNKTKGKEEKDFKREKKVEFFFFFFFFLYTYNHTFVLKTTAAHGQANIHKKLIAMIQCSITDVSFTTWGED